MRSVLALPFVFSVLAGAANVEFNRDIRPILSDRCFACHGPDAATRKGPFRLDLEASSKQDLGGRAAIVPGDFARSTLYQRVTSVNTTLRMPPAWAGGQPLTEREVGLLRSWIDQGAKWQSHWAYVPPSRPDFPRVTNQSWPRSGIDYFVLARLERDGLSPSQEASKAAILRRVTLDLTGLPPSPAELDDFLRDASALAYERVADRLLASPRYAERMAARWLDAARYADTNGYQTDAERFMWRWRDWVIDAFRRNLPFDQFTLWQIAGDQLPNATREQRIATGFNRNHRGNSEGGIIPEEYLVEYAADRVETTATVFLATTVGCARCHNHKYDPISQKEFYQLFAYFNNIPERGRYFKYGNTPPLVHAPTPPQEQELAAADAAFAAAESRWTASQPAVAQALAQWEKTISGSTEGSIDRSMRLHLTLDGDTGTAKWNGDSGSFAAGQIGQAASLAGGSHLELANPPANFGFYDTFTLAMWIRPEAATGALLTRTSEEPEDSGWGLYLKDGKLQVNLAARWLDDSLRVETEVAVPLGQWSHVLATYDGSRVADGIRIFINGAAQKLKINLDDLNQEFRVKDPLRIGGGGGPQNRFTGRIDDVRIYSDVLDRDEAAVVATAVDVDRIAATPDGSRTPAQREKLRRYFLDHTAPKEIQDAWREWNDARRRRAEVLARIPTVMVMQDNPAPKETHLLIRGAYDRPGEKVTPGVPAALGPIPASSRNDRLGLAKWLVDPANPLTARVIVNRFWQMYFGVGIVKTVEDFGSQGEPPSHQDLLDWLAVEFMQSGWDVKHLQKLIVTSATYRQSAKASREWLERDPENRLLARGPRLRLPAEMVRDQALYVSGLLVDKVGGPSVRPYQPAGLWKELSGGEDYKPDKGEGLYRRSLYSFWKRTAPPPMMMNFDSAGRETCVVRESRTNTPLQALNLMNDVTYVESARAMAQRMMREGGSSPRERISYGFRLATARLPGENELRVLVDGFHHHRDNYQSDRAAAAKFLSHGDSPRDESLDSADVAAYATVASLILNLDETVTK